MYSTSDTDVVAYPFSLLLGCAGARRAPLCFPYRAINVRGPRKFARDTHHLLIEGESERWGRGGQLFPGEVARGRPSHVAQARRTEFRVNFPTASLPPLRAVLYYFALERFRYCKLPLQKKSDPNVMLRVKRHSDSEFDLECQENYAQNRGRFFFCILFSSNLLLHNEGDS